MQPIRTLSILALGAAALLPVEPSEASQFVHGAICVPSGDNFGNDQPYTISEGGFETSGTIDITCALPVDAVPHANPSWRMQVQRSFGNGTITCNARVLDSAGETVANSTQSFAGLGEGFLLGTLVAPQSSSFSFALRCRNAPPVVIENIRVF